MIRWLIFFCAWMVGLPAAVGRPFTVLVYDVENLTGIDGKTTSADYLPTRYSRAHLLTKLNNITRLVQQFDEGRGPDIILFQEFERDFSNTQYVFDHDGMLRRFSKQRIEDMLGAMFTSEVARLPIEALLLKTFQDRGLTGYRVAAADDAILPDARRHIAHLNIVYTRFPIGAVRTYPLPGAPAMMEVQVEVEGYPLYLFDLHWPDSIADKTAEKLREQAARTLRQRLDDIFSVNPNADVIIGGNLNSYYDQKLRFKWERTALQDALRVRADELLLRNRSTDLYNLWYELPPYARGSEVQENTWSTCMQMIVSRGLYDFRGVQYVDNSFSVAAFEDLNATREGYPIPWSFRGIGEGFSAHLPIFARFTTVRNNRPDVFIKLPVAPILAHEADSKSR